MRFRYSRNSVQIAFGECASETTTIPLLGPGRGPSGVTQPAEPQPSHTNFAFSFATQNTRVSSLALQVLSSPLASSMGDIVPGLPPHQSSSCFFAAAIPHPCKNTSTWAKKSKFAVAKSKFQQGGEQALKHELQQCIQIALPIQSPKRPKCA